MGIFRAIGRLVRTIMYAITFQFDKMSQVWEKSPAVINATYDAIQQDQLTRIESLKRAVAGQLRFKLGQESRLKELARQIDEQERGMKGAWAMGQKRVAELAGKSPEEIKQDPEYLRCQKGYEDFKSTLVAKREEAARIETELTGLDKELGHGETALESSLRELDSIQKERHETIVDVQLAQQRKEVADLKTGLATTGRSEERQRMQTLRQQLRAEATISEKLAGIDTTKATEDFMAYAAQSEAANEFDQLLGVASISSIPAEPAVPASKAQLPEK